MRLNSALAVSCLGLAARGWLIDSAVPNPDHPGTRDVLSWPGAGPVFAAVPDEFTLEQVKRASQFGRLTAFTNNERWFTIGGRRMLLVVDEDDQWDPIKARKKGFELDEYPLVKSSQELETLLAEQMPIEEQRAEVADLERACRDRAQLQTDRVLRKGCAACRCVADFDKLGYC